MRITSVVLVVLLLCPVPGLAGKKKKQELEACMAKIEFLASLPDEESWTDAEPQNSRLHVAACVKWEDSEHTAWWKNWEQESSGVIDGREYLVLGPVKVENAWGEANPLKWAEDRLRRQACKKGGDAILERHMVCEFALGGSLQPDESPLGSWFQTGLLVREWYPRGVVIKWVDGDDGEDE